MPKVVHSGAELGMSNPSCGERQHIASLMGTYAIGIGLAALMGAVVVYGLTGQVWSEVGIAAVLLFWAGISLGVAGYVLERRRRHSVGSELRQT